MRKSFDKYTRYLVMALPSLLRSVQGNVKVVLAGIGVGVFLLLSFVTYNFASGEKEQAEVRFNEMQKLVHTHQRLLLVTGLSKERLASVEGSSTTLFSRIEELTKELQIARRVTTVRAEPSNGQERVRLAVHSLQTHEAVRLFFRIERTMKNIKIVQAQVVKQKKGLAVNLLIAPV